jgi:hypothetical protein
MTFPCNLRMFIAIYIGKRGGSLVCTEAYLLTERNFQQRQLQRRNNRKIVSNYLDREWKETHTDYLEAFSGTCLQVWRKSWSLQLIWPLFELRFERNRSRSGWPWLSIAPSARHFVLIIQHYIVCCVAFTWNSVLLLRDRNSPRLRVFENKILREYPTLGNKKRGD